MTFVSPFILIALVVIVPLVLLHRNKQSQKSLEFPAFDILIRVLARQKKRFKLKNMILLFLRILILIFIILALSKPEIKVRQQGGMREGLPLLQVAVIDTSASMRLKDDLKSKTDSFKRAQILVKKECGRLRPQDSFSIVTGGYLAKKITEVPLADKDAMVHEVEKLKCGYGENNLNKAIDIASNIIESSNYPNSEIFLVTDLTGRQPKDKIKTDRGNLIRITDVNGDSLKKTDNIAVAGVNIFRSGNSDSNEVTVEAELKNYSSSSVTALQINLYIDDKMVADGKIDIPPSGISKKKFIHTFKKSGVHVGKLVIESDLMPADDKRYFAVNINPEIKVLIIDSNRIPGSFMDYAFYLEKALNTPVSNKTAISVTNIDASDGAKTPFKPFDVIFLAGAGNLTSKVSERLISYVSQGGGLFIAPYENVEKLELLDSLLPAKIYKIKKTSPNKELHLGKIDYTNPLVKGMEVNFSGLENLSAKSYLLFEPDAEIVKTVPIEFDNKMPFILTRKVNKGKVVLLALTLDRTWSNLPILPGFLPLVQRSARFLADNTGDQMLKSVSAGESLDIKLHDGVSSAVVITPSKKEYQFLKADFKKKSIRFKHTDIPGYYRLLVRVPSFGGLKELPEHSFTVNTSTEESDLKETFQKIRNTKDETYKVVESKFPIWSYFLFVLMILLIIEIVFSAISTRGKFF